MRFTFLILLLLLTSCGKQKSVQLPEVDSAKTTTVSDHSSAYIFYDETQKDSIYLNRNNLISTTNWIVNVDKRLTLKQVIPKIIFLQDKKRNAKMHKNEDAKNYFSCSDKSLSSIGFIDFTAIFYHLKGNDEFAFSKSDYINYITLHFDENYKNSLSKLKHLNYNDKTQKQVLILKFKKSLTFQDYITIKSQFVQMDLASSSLSQHEFIY